MRVEELAYHKTALGELTLRRRVETMINDLVVYEVKLGDDFLMASHFIEGERQLSLLGLAAVKSGGPLDVVVGGLGLGYTAAAALEDPRVRSLMVIDVFPEVISWHRDKLVPMGATLVDDPRCELRQGDFFGLSRSGFDESAPNRKFDAVLLDIDHSPENWLDPANEYFYDGEGLAAVGRQLKPGGVFALWSDDPADPNFTAHLENVFGHASGHDVEFPNPYTGATSLNSVYVAWGK